MLGLAQAVAAQVDDERGGRLAGIVAHEDRPAAQVARGLVAAAGEAEGVVGLHGAGGFRVEQFVVSLAGREELDARQVQGEAVDRLHPQGRVDARMVLVLDPADELVVEEPQAG